MTTFLHHLHFSAFVLNRKETMLYYQSFFLSDERDSVHQGCSTCDPRGYFRRPAM